MNSMAQNSADLEFANTISSRTDLELFKKLDDRIRSIRSTSQLVSNQQPPNTKGTLPERLFDSAASFKTYTSQVSMHLGKQWRDKLFWQLDNLLDAAEWDSQDLPPSLSSYSSLLRALLKIMPEKKPGLGATADGHLIATWTEGGNRLTLHCLPYDQFIWTLTRYFGSKPERAGGTTDLNRLTRVLEPYDPTIWFDRAE
jgi:hypothetical protein